MEVFFGLVWIIIGVLYVAIKPASEGSSIQPLVTLIFGSIFLVVMAACFAAGAAGMVLLGVLVLCCIPIWNMSNEVSAEEKKKQEAKRAEESPYYEIRWSGSRYYKRSKRFGELFYQWNRHNQEPNYEFFENLLKSEITVIGARDILINDISIKPYTPKNGFVKATAGDLIISYILTKEKIEPDFPYAETPNSANFKIFERHMDKHCVKNGVVFHEWGRPERPVSFPLEEDVEKYHNA